MKALPKKDFPVEQARRFLEPGPIVLVSTAWQGQRNLMTMGWHMVMGFSPSLVATYLWNENHSHALAVGSGECVINVPGVELLDTVVDIGNCSGREVDKFARFGLDALPASEVGAPLVGQCHSNFECRLYDDSQVASSNLFIWEIVRAHVAPRPKLPRTVHYRGDGQFMVAGTECRVDGGSSPTCCNARTPPHAGPPRMTEHLTDLDAAVDWLFARVDGPMRIGAPLALGKPHRLLNALYARVEHDPSRPLQLYTALSLNPPKARGNGLEARFLAPFAQRHFGDDFPRLAYADAIARDALPAHVQVEEFYMQSGALLGSRQAQSSYTSLNYTHAADAVAQRAPQVIVQKVAMRPDDRRLSLSCNNDITQDTLDAMTARGLPRPLLIAEIDPQLPYLGGSATVDVTFFDLVITPPPPYPALFGLPRQPVGDADYAIGLYASTLVRDGGTLQIGIGTLADALSHALVLRHTDNARYRRVLHALDPQLASHPLVQEIGGLDPFEVGLYGCSEMLNEGFRRLVQTGVIKRKVHDDLALMQRIENGSTLSIDHATLAAEGEYLHGAFYLGSPEFYEWLRTLPEDECRAIGMRRISEINQLYGGNETLERLQRRHARFFNSCMMATALGAAVSDALDDGRVVSGVGGQYNFVAMAHALPEARSVLMFRAARDDKGQRASNVRWNYGHTTIPRHLRDIYLNEYGIADLRGLTDEDCVHAMTAITEAPFQDELLQQAQASRKLLAAAQPDPARQQRNTPQALAAALAPFRADGSLPDYPLGSDFNEIEQVLVKALAWLKANTQTRADKLRTVWAALRQPAGDGDTVYLQRMGLQAPKDFAERLDARLLRLALARTA